MNILIIHEVSYVQKPIYEYQDFAERLAGRGHQVTVIDFCEKKQQGLLIEKVNRTGMGAVLLVSLPNNGLPLVKYLFAFLCYPFILRRIIKQQQIEAVLLYSVFINGVSTLPLCKRFGIPVVYRVLDAYHRLRKNRFESWLLLLCEKYIYRNVEKISVTNRKMGDYVTGLMQVKNSRPLYVTDHGVDTVHFHRMDFNEQLANSLKICKEDFVCAFLGTTYSFSRLDEIVEQFKLIRKSIPTFKLLILGSGELDISIRRMAEKMEEDERVLQPGMISYDELPAYLSLANIAICPFEINRITRDIIPIKIIQYLAMELPVFCTPLPDVCNNIPNEISGVFYSQSDSIDNFVATMVQMIPHLELKNVGRRARRYAKENYSMDRTMINIEKLLERR